MPATYIVDATIADIRLLTTASRLSTSYYSTDTGKQGIWNVYPADGTTDNGGTNLIDADGNVWKRLIPNNEFMPEWFLGTGTDPVTTAINEALVAAENQSVLISGGQIYAVSKINITNPVRLTGNGTLQKSAGSSSAPVINIQSSNVIIENITIDGNRSSFTGSSATRYYGIDAESTSTNVYNQITIRNVCISNTNNEAVYSESCSDIRIENCTIENCGLPSSGTSAESTIFIRSSLGLTSANVVISGCLFSQDSSVNENNNGCIKMGAEGGGTIQNIIVSGNICNLGDYLLDSSTATILGIECYTVFIGESDGTILNLLIENNIVNCAAQNISGANSIHVIGISLGGNSYYSSSAGIIGAVAANNIVRSCRKYGIELIGSHITAIGNELYDSGFISVNANTVFNGMNGVKVIGNTLKTNVGYNNSATVFGGILIQVIDQDMHGTLIEGNVFDGVSGTDLLADIIYVKGGAGYTIYDLSIVNNHFLNIVRNGIHFDSNLNIQNANISANIFRNNDESFNSTSGYSIYVNAATLNKLSVTNNTFNCAVPVEMPVIVNYAIGLYGPAGTAYTNLIFSDNVFDSAHVGLYVTNPANGLTINSNVFNSAAYAIYATSAVENLIINENIFNSSSYCIYNTNTVAGLIIKGNVFNSASYGVYATNTVDDLIINGNLFNTINYAIYLTSTVAGLIIKENIFDTTTHSIDITTAYTSGLINDNIFKSGGTIAPNTAATMAVTSIVDTTTSTYSAATLNSTYSSAAIGQTIICPNINLIYEKTTATQWIAYATTVVT